MVKKPIRAAIIGCGNIAPTYVEQIKSYPSIELVGFMDIIRERSTAFSDKYGGRDYETFEALLKDETVELVINLTIHDAHYDVSSRCLKAGKHVYTEKPLALSYEEAKELVALAEQNGLRLSSAPITYMGEAQQTAWKVIREGTLGKTRVAYAEINHGRIETWHPNPIPFYGVGIVWDVAIYPITLLTTFFGPARRVTAFGKVICPDRITLDGIPYQIETPDFTLAMIEFASGPLLRLTASFYVRDSKQGSSVEVHGDKGSLYLGSCFDFHAPVEICGYDEEMVPIPLLRELFSGVEFARGLNELVVAMAEDRPHRAAGIHAAHVVEIISAIHQSIETGDPVTITSRFTPPDPM